MQLTLGDSDSIQAIARRPSGAFDPQRPAVVGGAAHMKKGDARVGENARRLRPLDRVRRDDNPGAIDDPVVGAVATQNLLRRSEAAVAAGPAMHHRPRTLSACIKMGPISA